MLGRQASSYGRKFFYGKHKPIVDPLSMHPGIGLLPPEFDDLEMAESAVAEEIRAMEKDDALS